MALDLALPGMCLGGKRMVTVPPRMGWSNNNAHHDTIRSGTGTGLSLVAAWY